MIDAAEAYEKTLQNEKLEKELEEMIVNESIKGNTSFILHAGGWHAKKLLTDYVLANKDKLVELGYSVSKGTGFSGGIDGNTYDPNDKGFDEVTISWITPIK